jgi:hypothetical protein
MPHLLYIGQTPAEGTGSPVIILRHLQRLQAAGWKISVVAEAGQDTSACVREGWTLHALPLRRFWWPPFRPDIDVSRAWRTRLLANEVRRLTAEDPPDAVLGYVAAHDDFSAEIAARFARRSGKLLTLLVHDDAAAFSTDPRAQARVRQRQTSILQYAHRCWFVSPELANAFAGLPASAQRVLPPIPASPSHSGSWRAEFAAQPRIYYAGFVWPAQFPLLAKIARTLTEAGTHLVLLTRQTPALEEFLRTTPITHIAPFPSNAEALRHLAQEAAGVIVSYTETVEEMPWIATSFPSKLVEYSQLGLPCAIVAPADSAVGRWARRVGGVDFFLPNELDRLREWAADLRKETAWNLRSAPSQKLAMGEFSPDKIQATFASGLLHE